VDGKPVAIENKEQVDELNSKTVIFAILQMVSQIMYLYLNQK